MSEVINGIMEDLDKNIKLLKDADEINLKDVQELFVMLFEIQKDMYDKLQVFFEQMKKVKEIEKGNKYKEKEIINEDIKRLYQ